MEAAAAGTRALESLRAGVEEAIAALGSGFLAHPANQALRDRLRAGELATADYYRQLLRLVYRLIFLFVAEDRELLHGPDATELPRRRYVRHYSLGRLREMAARSRGGPHPDLWAGLRVVLAALGRPGGERVLGLPALGSFLWSADTCSDLDAAELANRDLLSAIRALAFTKDERDKVLRPVDWRNLGSEELGSVYESLLELHPEVEADAARFELRTAAGNERKVTGSYYTPTSLITCLLDSALDPVLDEAAAKPDPEAAILALKVLDPACGSGHFLIAAAHRIAKRLAAVRTGDAEPAPESTRRALRDVIGRCIHGIDINPMAVELCKVSLWMESLEPGRPLSFLEHRIVCGNSLLGTTPALLAKGIPDEAFKALEGDDPKVATELRKRNKQERDGQQTLALTLTNELVVSVGRAVAELDAVSDAEFEGVAEKERRYAALQTSAAARQARLLADAWCAAFVLEKGRGAPVLTHGVLDRLRRNTGALSPDLAAAVEDARERYRFLHLHLAFPHVFGICKNGDAAKGMGWTGGFDVVLGNPPWEQTELQEQQFFATRDPEIAALPGAKRKAAIAALEYNDPALFEEYRGALHQADAGSHVLRSSGRFPLCGRGRVNLYTVFAELMRQAISPAGRVVAVLPSGIATDDTTKYFFADLVEHRSLASLFDFENRERIFQDVDARMKFCLLTLTGPDRQVEGADFVFFAHRTSDLTDAKRRFTLSPEDFSLLNPNTRTCAVFRSRRDAELTKAIYRRVPALFTEGPPERNPWGVTFRQGLFNMTSDSALFRTAAELERMGALLKGNMWQAADGRRWLPLYEAKMLHHFTHRWGDYAMQRTGSKDTQLPDIPEGLLADSRYVVQPRYWVEEHQVDARLGSEEDSWFLGFRDVTNVTNERTVIANPIPRVAVGHKLPLFFSAKRLPLLGAALTSCVFDYVARQKMGGTSLGFFVLKQLPMLPPEAYERPTPWEPRLTLAKWIRSYVLELTYTSWDMEGFATDLGYDGPPFRWDEERRALLRAELDACFFHLYGLEADDVAYVMDTFPIVRRKDEERYGEYRTKRLILEAYEAMAKAAATGEPYQTRLDPPPADPRVAHPTRR